MLGTNFSLQKHIEKIISNKCLQLMVTNLFCLCLATTHGDTTCSLSETNRLEEFIWFIEMFLQIVFAKVFENILYLEMGRAVYQDID